MHNRQNDVPPDAPERSSSGKGKPPMQQMAQYADLALVMPGGVVGGWIVGYALDRWLGTHWIYLIGIILGMIGGFVHIVRAIGRGPKNEQ